MWQKCHEKTWIGVQNSFWVAEKTLTWQFSHSDVVYSRETDECKWAKWRRGSVKLKDGVAGALWERWIMNTKKQDKTKQKKSLQLHDRCISAKAEHVFQLKLSRKSPCVSPACITSRPSPSEVTGYVLKNRKHMIEIFAGLSSESKYLWPLGWLVHMADSWDNTFE